jgi:hypothetical protein
MLSALVVFLTAGALFAQTGNRPDAGPEAGARFTPPEQTTVSGNLGIRSGMLSIESGGSLYYVMGLDRFIGFIDGLKEGAAVSLTGYVFDSPRRSGAKIFRVTELRLSGKSYDLAPPAEVGFPRGGNGPRDRTMVPQGSRPGSRDRHRGNGPDRRGPCWD